MKTKNLVAAAGALAAGLIVAIHGWGATDTPGLPGPDCGVAAGSAAMNINLEESKRRIWLKSLIAEELVAGRLTYPEAAEQALAINRTSDLVMEILHLRYPDLPEEEAVALVLMTAVRNILGEDSSRLAEVEARLGAEWLAAKGRPLQHWSLHQVTPLRLPASGG
jgi:hypothetical protein